MKSLLRLILAWTMVIVVISGFMGLCAFCCYACDNKALVNIPIIFCIMGGTIAVAVGIDALDKNVCKD